MALGLLRVPALIGGGITAAVVYVQYKVEEGTRYGKDLLKQGAEYVGGTWEFVKTRVEGATDFELPALEMPSWMAKALRFEEAASTKDKAQGEGSGGNGPNHDSEAAAVIAAGTAAAYTSSDEELPRKAPRDDQMMVLTRKMIEIRNLLKQVDQTEALTLPSIVVIGSQSSGKSSVLEALVGHEFLPKGTNMVTRRPIELTLINTPGASEYGSFPALGPTKITDFSQIQTMLTTMNKAVSDEECVSDDPIQLNIYSPNVPDLTLIDLPGYIQIQSKDQPTDLKWKIAELCDKYIQEPNLILAVCAADVDLANSPALRASRKVDPLGIRTLGVVTKMDLVTPDRGVATLKDANYPLSLGYIGVVCKAPQPSTSLFRRESALEVMSRNERAFFSASTEYADCDVGTSTLRSKLMSVLERSMAASLQRTSDAIRQELEEAAYQFKVQYNDRSLTAETYVAETIDAFKHDFKAFSATFGKLQVRSMLKAELDQRVLELVAERYWSDPKMIAWATQPNADAHWSRKLDATQSALTRMGVGRLSTTLVTSRLASEMENLANAGSLRNHPFAKEIICHAARDIMNARYHGTAEQVENCIKPYKFEVDVEREEWQASRQRAAQLMEEELKLCRRSYAALSNAVGARQLARVMEYAASGRETKESMGYSQALLEKGRQASFLTDREAVLLMRSKFLRSKACATTEGKYVCPEIFLDAVAQKLTQTAVLFINVELLSEFFYQFPRELDHRLIHNLSRQQVELFAKEDPKIKAHIELQEKKELLELALTKMESVMQIEKDKQQDERRQGDGQTAAGGTGSPPARRPYWKS
ncbi:P-loop containing nucleoside triphosphate hydrolase protein [Protomyces lactucae-debilis]|uniref:dynamin GTPase n=1 Tax=Protomyces lactucae-debilis TaxID=2754530 RepID=A0A1Y2EU28_PROLT|nr:P-loop containing nucleoside triphosphate hydrolase protein [Protomyces lactucae-debilis]ORY75070.1 P-loop containing nucleoside triphosphate hydrolase protein [Protomyces lactucae-debilis]